MNDTVIRKKRKVTAKEAAKRLGLSERTIRNYQAEYRNDYEKRAAERREMAHKLRSHGMTWADVGKALNCSPEAARALSNRFIAQEKAKQEKKEEKLDNFDLF